MRRRDPQHIHEAHRAAHVARLVHYGRMTEDAAEEAASAWEALADAEGRQRDHPGYWQACDEWAVARWRRSS